MIQACLIGSCIHLVHGLLLPFTELDSRSLNVVLATLFFARVYILATFTGSIYAQVLFVAFSIVFPGGRRRGSGSGDS